MVGCGPWGYSTRSSCCTGLTPSISFCVLVMFAFKEQLEHWIFCHTSSARSWPTFYLEMNGLTRGNRIFVHDLVGWLRGFCLLLICTVLIVIPMHTVKPPLCELYASSLGSLRLYVRNGCILTRVLHNVCWIISLGGAPTVVWAALLNLYSERRKYLWPL